jgi:uncharacterized protein
MKNVHRRLWFPTYTGIKFYPLTPTPEMIRIEDIAHHLSLICRFLGATRTMDSVAQHSVVVSRCLQNRENADVDTLLWGLLHDAGEAYSGDMVPPIKAMSPFIQRIENRVLRIIIEKYNLKWPEPPIVKKWDMIIGNNEVSWWLKDPAILSDYIEGTEKVRMSYWSSEESEKAFLDRFYQLLQSRQSTKSFQTS